MFRSYEIDFDARIVRVELVDGSIISEPMATRAPRYDSIRRARLDIERRLLVFTLDDDTTLETELGFVRAIAADRRTGDLFGPASLDRACSADTGTNPTASIRA